VNGLITADARYLNGMCLNIMNIMKKKVLAAIHLAMIGFIFAATSHLMRLPQQRLFQGQCGTQLMFRW